jgi:hypothetical protein
MGVSSPLDETPEILQTRLRQSRSGFFLVTYTSQINSKYDKAFMFAG